jgi:hypothetical protein
MNIGRARLQACQKEAAPQALPLCRGHVSLRFTAAKPNPYITQVGQFDRMGRSFRKRDFSGTTTSDSSIVLLDRRRFVQIVS